MCVRYGGDGDRVGRRGGRAGGPEPEVVAVVPCGDHRHDARGGEVVDRLDERVVRRIDLRAAAGEVDHVHAVSHGCLECGDDLGCVRDVPERRRHGEDAVVAEPRSWCDAAQAADGRMVGTGGRGRAGDAGGDAGHVCAVKRRVGVDPEPARTARVRPREDARHDHLRRGPFRRTAGKAGRIRKAGRGEEAIRLVDPVVDHADLHARSVCSGRLAEDIRSDHRR